MSKIKNHDELATTDHRRDALDILEAGYAAIDTETVLRTKIKMEGDELCIADDRYKCHLYENIYVIGIGKCALDAAYVLEDILGDRITGGVVLDINQGVLQKIRSFAGTHPLPSEQNVSVTKEIASLIGQAGEQDLVIVIISGGGSALLCLPFNTSCDTLIRVTQEMTKQGADIYELNTVRKHLSEIQGGQLAKLAYPAEVISLIFSDVLGDDLSVIASGPTVKDQTSAEEAEAILKKYHLFNNPDGTNLLLTETPKDDKYFQRVSNILAITNQDAITAMEKQAQTLGYKVIPGSSTLSGEARVLGAELAQTPLRPGQVQISGGETTVTITGSGQGGRNQEVVLAGLEHLNPSTTLISAASDGRDNTDVAGAIGDRKLLEKARELYLDPKTFLENNDSYNFFKNVGGQIKTGSTGSNVSDLFILLSK